MNELEAVHVELADAWRDKQPAPVFDGVRATYTDLSHTVVVPDAAVSDVRSNTSELAPSTTFSCETGHASTSPLCALCDDGNNNMTLDQFRRRQLLQHRPAARVPGIYDVRKFRTVLNQPCRRANA